MTTQRTLKEELATFNLPVSKLKNGDRIEMLDGTNIYTGTVIKCTSPNGYGVKRFVVIDKEHEEQASDLGIYWDEMRAEGAVERRSASKANIKLDSKTLLVFATEACGIRLLDTKPSTIVSAATKKTEDKQRAFSKEYIAKTISTKEAATNLPDQTVSSQISKLEAKLTAIENGLKQSKREQLCTRLRDFAIASGAPPDITVEEMLENLISVMKSDIVMQNAAINKIKASQTKPIDLKTGDHITVECLNDPSHIHNATVIFPPSILPMAVLGETCERCAPFDPDWNKHPIGIQSIEHGKLAGLTVNTDGTNVQWVCLLQNPTKLQAPEVKEAEPKPETKSEEGINPLWLGVGAALGGLMGAGYSLSKNVPAARIATDTTSSIIETVAEKAAEV